MTWTEELPTAADFYAELKASMGVRPDTARAYSLLNSSFQRLLSIHTGFTRVHLVGTFARTDYLLKEHHASRQLVRMLGDARVRLQQVWRGALSEEQQQIYLQADFQAVCLFVQMLYDVEVPAELMALFPERRPRRKSRKLLGECERILVRTWDEHYIYGALENDGAGDVKVAYAEPTEPYPCDRSYLYPLFCEGMQLHLIRPRMEDGVIYPELVILEPDYLVDISQVAACMQEYADSPLVGLLRQLEPVQITEPIMLGNLAGQLLDEELHPDVEDRAYIQSATRFFRHNALSLLSVPVTPDFHTEARRQQQHIRQSVRTDLPRIVSGFQPSHVMVEPSFFSPMLGLQGRMDFLQLDMRLLIEQKSGKGAFVPGDSTPDIPRVRREHYAQLLLYMALLRYNYREQYEANNRELYTFLLYSRYETALQGLSFAPELLFDALKLRNQMVWHQFRLAEDGFRVLETMTPERLNRKNLSTRLWTHFQRPHIESILNPIRSASPTERAYYFRMLSFVAREQMLSKLGNKTKENSGFASIWLSSLDDKLAAGNIYHRLQLLSPSVGDEGRVEEVSLRFAEQAGNDMSNFRIGDIVILYSYEPDTLPEAGRTMVFRCSICRLTADTITLHLRYAQTDAHVFTRHADRLWAIEHDFYESSYAALYRGLHAFLSAPQERRDLILLQRSPQVDGTLEIKGEYGRFNDLALRVRQSRELFLIIGPPGTGKTSYGMLNTLQEELMHTGTNVLVMSYTNRAVDEICSKLEGVVDYIRVGSTLACAEPYRRHLLDSRIRECRNVEDLASELARTRVFVGTTTALNAHLQLFRHKQFSLAIIDEASQILEPHLMGLFSAMHGMEPAIRRFVMIGDHKQLPAVVQQRQEESAVDDALLHRVELYDCRLSLFERLLRRYADDPGVTYMLTCQGRMHEEIADFPNRMFYGGRLHVVPLQHQQRALPSVAPSGDAILDMLRSRRVAFLACDAPLESPSDKVNQPEANLIAGMLRRIYEMRKEDFQPEHTVGVIVPYRNQIATIRNTVAQFGIPQLAEITIDTVERYQGSQRDFIIYGFTVQKRYQLSFLTDHTFVEDGRSIDRKLNVAMTRAREHLIMVGNPSLLKLNPIFRQLIEEYE